MYADTENGPHPDDVPDRAQRVAAISYSHEVVVEVAQVIAEATTGSTDSNTLFAVLSDLDGLVRSWLMDDREQGALVALIEAAEAAVDTLADA